MDRKSFLGYLSLSPFFMQFSSLHSLEQYGSSPPHSEKMPLLFLGHGSPMNAIEDNQFVRGFHTIAKTLPEPKAILCISAHWYTRGTQVMASAMPKTIHDFGGFPDALYQVQYPALGDPKLAKEVSQLILPHTSTLSEEWGLDHGAWTVLMHLFPKANIPVIQLSIDYTKDAQYHYDLAHLLKKLRNKGILIVGSGNIVHNLGMIDWANFDKDNHGYDWAKEVREKTNTAIIDGNHHLLIEYTKQGKAFQNAIPTPDHYLPLIYTLAMQDKSEKVELFNDKLLAGSLSMTSVRIG